MRFVNSEDDPIQLAKDGVEVWLPVPFSPTRYYVSNLGRVASRVYANSPPRLVGGTQLSSGYLTVSLTAERGGTPQTQLVHRVVCEAFFGPPPSDQQYDVLHADNDKTNNALNNIAWGTRSDNMKDVWLSRAAGAANATRLLAKKKSQYMGRTADEALVRKGQLLHQQGKLSVDDLAILWDCPRSVAYDIVSGRRKHGIDPDLVVPTKGYRSEERKSAIRELVAKGMTAAQINERLGESLSNGDAQHYRKVAGEAQMPESETARATRRVHGGRHHNAVLTDEEVREGLRVSVENGWGASRMKEYWGVSLATASQILSGVTWKHIERPRALEGQVHARGTKLYDEKVAEGLRLAAENNWTGAQLGEYLGVSRAVGGEILGGRAWTHVPRPEGLTVRSVAASLTDEQVYDGLVQAKANGWGATQLGEYLGVKRGVAHKILSGTGYKHVRRPV